MAAAPEVEDRRGFSDLEVDQVVLGCEIYKLISPPLKSLLQLAHLSSLTL